MKTSTFLTALALSGVLSASAQGAGVSRNFTPNGTIAAPQATLDGIADPADALTNPFQFYDAAAITTGSGAFSSTRAFVAGTDFPQGNYFFENHGNATHSISPAAKVATTYELTRLISEPASELLMLVALGALAIAVRRKMPA